MKKLDRGFFYKNYLAKQGIFSYHSSVVLAHPLFRWMMLRGERTSCQVWFFLFFVPYTNIYQRIRIYNSENSVPQKTARSYRTTFYYKDFNSL